MSIAANENGFTRPWAQYAELWQASAALIGFAYACIDTMPAGAERAQTERLVGGYARTIRGVLCDDRSGR